MSSSSATQATATLPPATAAMPTTKTTTPTTTSTTPTTAPPELLPFLSQSPAQAPSLCQTYHDLVYSSKWSQVNPHFLPSPTLSPITQPTPPPPSVLSDATALLDYSRALQRTSLLSDSDGIVVLVATPPATIPTGRIAILPVAQHQHIAPQDVQQVLERLNNLQEGGKEVEQEAILLAIMAGDGTVVYYRIAKGLVKPVN